MQYTVYILKISLMYGCSCGTFLHTVLVAISTVDMAAQYFKKSDFFFGNGDS